MQFSLYSLKGGKVFDEPKVILESDVNVPHGKAATETLMLTTVVSPGRQMTPGRSGEEEGSYDVTE